MLAARCSTPVNNTAKAMLANNDEGPGVPAIKEMAKRTRTGVRFAKLWSETEDAPATHGFGQRVFRGPGVPAPQGSQRPSPHTPARGKSSGRCCCCCCKPFWSPESLCKSSTGTYLGIVQSA